MSLSDKCSCLKRVLFLFILIIGFDGEGIGGKVLAQSSVAHFSYENTFLTDDQNGFFKNAETGERWEIVSQTEKEMILLKPNGEPVKISIDGEVATPIELTPDEKMDIEYQSMAYTPQSPYIVLNPYRATPLTALIRFKTEKPAGVRLTVKGKGGAPDVSFDYPNPQTEHRLPVLGLYPKHNNQIELTVYADEQEKTYPLFIQTQPLERRNIYVPIVKKDKDNYFYFSSAGFVYDEYGFARYHIKKAGLLYFYPEEIVTENRQHGLKRFDLWGRELQQYPYPAGFTSFTHGIGRMPNGDFLVIGTQKGMTMVFDGKKQPTHRDILLVLDYKTGKEIKRFDIAELLNPTRENIVRPAFVPYIPADWLHMNSVQYDATDNSLVISGRHVGMAKIDYETGALKWVFGPALGYEKSGRDGNGGALWHKVLVAVDENGKPFNTGIQQGVVASSDFYWPTTTHDAKVWGNGYFSILNNGDTPYDKRIVSHKDSHGMIFKIDESQKTIRLVWAEKTGLFSALGSTVNILPDFKSVFVFLSEVEEENSNLKYGYLVRYDYKTKEKLFEAVLHCHNNGWDYQMQPVDLHDMVLK